MTISAPKAGETGRILRGLAGGVAGVGARLFGQLAILPLLFSAWDADRVGIWMLLTAIPAYLTLAGNGFAGAGGNMTLAAAQAGHIGEARERFAASWLLATGVTGALCLLYVLAALALSGTQFLGAFGDDGYGDRSDVVLALALLAIYILAIGQLHLLEIPFRVAGRYGEYQMIGALAVAGDAVAVAVALAVADSFAGLAAAMALGRIMITGAAYLVARRLAPDLLAGSAPDLRRGMAGMVRPSLGLMLLPLVFGLNIQGYAVLIGSALGPVVLAAFVTTRTLVRLLDVAMGLTFTLQFYELGYLGANRSAIERRNLATMTALTLLVFAGFAGAIMLLGPWLQGLLSDGDTRFDHSVAAVLLLAGGFRALASNPVAMLAARNRMARVSALYCAASALGLALAAAALAAGAPLWAALCALMLAEMAQAVHAFRTMLEQMDQTPTSFIRSLVARERVTDLTEIAGRLTGLKRGSR